METEENSNDANSPPVKGKSEQKARKSVNPVHSDTKRKKGDSNMQFICRECGIIFTTKNPYEEHMAVFHDPNDRLTVHLCVECGTIFHHIEEYTEHMVGHTLIDDINNFVPDFYDIAPKDVVKPVTRTREKHKTTAHASRIQPQLPINLPRTSSASSFMPENVLNGTESSDMPATCCIANCVNHTDPGLIHMHKFRPQSLALWAKNMNIGESIAAAENARICSRHFETNCFSRLEPNGAYLREDAIPTRYPFKGGKAVKGKKRKNEKQMKVVLNDRTGSKLVTPQHNALLPANQRKSAMSKCPKCEKQHDSVWYMLRHAARTHSALIKNIEQQYDKDDQIVDKLVHDGYDACRYCQQKASDTHHALLHLISEHSEKLYALPDPKFGAQRLIIKVNVMFPETNVAKETGDKECGMQFTVSIRVTLMKPPPGLVHSPLPYPTPIAPKGFAVTGYYPNSNLVASRPRQSHSHSPEMNAPDAAPDHSNEIVID